jgi:hypothetical protein
MAKHTSSAEAERDESAVEYQLEPANAAMVKYDENGNAVFELAEAVIPDELDISQVPTIEQRLAEAKMPVLKKTQELLGHDVLWYAWRPQDALLVNEGTITEGFFCLGKDLETGQVFTVFIGGIALCRTLRNVNAPMVARIEKSGRALVFK